MPRYKIGVQVIYG